jgi:hypothetical protein
MSQVRIEAQVNGGLWQTLMTMNTSDSVGIKMRLDEAHRMYKVRCRATDTKTGCVVDFRG